MIGNSRISVWVIFSLLLVLASCATEPYYEAAPISPVSVSPGEDINIGINAQTTFVWLPSENTQFYEFHIYNQVNKDTSQYRRAKLLESKVCIEGLCRVTLNVDLPKAKGHAWRVRAGNNAGLSEWNRTRFNMIDSIAGADTTAASDSEPAASVESGAGTAIRASDGEVVSIEAAMNESADANTEQSATSDELSIVELTPNAELANNVNTERTTAANVNTNVDNNVDISTDINADIDTAVNADKLVVLDSQPDENIPELIQPVKGVKVTTGSLVDFKWRSLRDAVSYDFYIYDSVSNEMVEALTNISAKTLCRGETICRLTRVVSLPEASHAWRVRANYQSGQSPFSSSRFAVVR